MSALMSCLVAVAYATCVALTNCGLTAPESKRHSVLALAGSWMSRITMVESSPTLPITRVSPTGMAASQRTSPAPPGAPVGAADGAADAVADGPVVGLDVGIGCGGGRAEGVLVEGGEGARRERQRHCHCQTPENHAVTLPGQYISCPRIRRVSGPSLARKL